MLSRGLAFLMRISHTFILTFVVMGCLFPQRSILVTHVIFIPLMVLQWVLNKDRCVLTQWEHRLRNAPASEREEEDGFVKSLGRLCVRDLPSDKTVKQIIWSVTWTSWFISVARLAFHK